MTGTIVKGVGGLYTVRDEKGDEYMLRAQSKLRYQKLKPMVGDRVKFAPGQEETEGWLEKILPRQNSLLRPPVANVQILVWVMAATTPLPDLYLADTMLVWAAQTDIRVIIAVNKCDDEASWAEVQGICAQYAGAGVECYCVSAKTGRGIAALKEALKGTVHLFGGQSGVGKSSLINALYHLKAETGSISRKTERGRHVTRHIEMFWLEENTRVLDTPGFNLLENVLMDPMDLTQYYPEFVRYEGQCKFSPCSHLSEPDCRVLEALDAGEINRERWKRYKNLFEEMKVRWEKRYG